MGKNMLAKMAPLLMSIFLACICGQAGFTQQSGGNDSLTQNFYNLGHHQLHWFSSARNLRRASDWLTILESSDYLGIRADKTRTSEIRKILLNRNALDGKYKESADRQITGMVLHFIKELQEGNIRWDYDEISAPRDTQYINELLYPRRWESPSRQVARLDCKDAEYIFLKNFLHDSVPPGDSLKYKEVVRAMNYRRYLTINHLPEYLLINIPEAEAVYYRNNLPVLRMRAVVGREKSQTPLIASFMTSVVTFPHWNVPYGIAVNELLPKVLKNENYLEQNNFEIVDAKGNAVDDSEINWADYNTTNFPYFFRQATGAGNSLGVLKFNIGNPFSIFLHSTSAKSAFALDRRYLSHGCIRLEKPLELADSLLRGKLDINELKSGKKNTESKIIPLPGKVQVFIIYSPAIITGQKVTYLRDSYKLIK